MNDFANRIANLSPEARALFEAKLRQKAAAKQYTIPTLPRSGQAQAFAQSFAQQRLWFLYQWEPASPFYNINSALKLEGELDVAAFERCINEIVKRHESLRTSFTTQENEAVQIIHPSANAKVSFVDLRGFSPSERDAEMRRLAAEESERPFDLSRAPLIRVSLLQLEDTSHVTLTALHHIISDGWSIGVFYREVTALYQAFAKSKAVSLPELSIQYPDYAVWQRGHLSGEVLEPQLAYWKERLSGAPPLLELPTDRPRPALQSFKGARLSRVLDKTLLDAVKTVGQADRATLFMTLLAAFSVLLSRYCRSDDIVIGSPIAGRTRTETEHLIGFFVNTLTLRTDLSGDPSFREHLSRVRETALSAYAHQDLPFEKLVEELKPERSLSYSPLFQVMFVLQNTTQAPLRLPGLKVERLDLGRETSKFDLSLYVIETSEGLKISFEYNRDLFDAATIVRMMSHFETLLKSIVENPGQKISRLALLTVAERHALIHDWNQPRIDYPNDATIVQLFEAQVRRSPQAVALAFDDQEFTYEEINRRANRLAHHLISLGVGPDVLVGIFVERSFEMIVGLLGILKAGGAYVPLDPGYPIERLGFMLSDAALAVVVAQQGLELTANGAKLLRLDSDRSAIAAQPDHNPADRADAEALAYIIYTSGSTGKPKGVCIAHRALANLLHAMREHTAITEEDSLLAVTTLSFDIAALELYLPLIAGARLVLASRETAADGEALSKCLADCRITLMQATPATWRLLIEAGWQGSDKLRVLCGGEALPQELADQLLARCESVSNLYGPTETTIWSSAERVRANQTISIGRPLANTEIYILDGALNQAPIGVPGELHIAGAGLARGYLNRPELTAEKFISNPFSDKPGARLYKTGDLARYRADGNIEFLGRIDSQVKLRGFRIELGEIEACLRQHSKLREAAVLAREDHAGEKRLAAYFVHNEASAPASADELRSFLKNLLPDYMLPSSFVALDQMPLTANGKLDRKALPAPDRLLSDSAPVAPRTLLEQQLAAIFAAVLKIDRVGIRDNFFDLGGHSFLVLRVVAEIEKNCGRRLSVATLFQSPTVEEIGQILAAGDSLDESDVIVPLNPHGTTPPLFSVWMGLATELRELCRCLGPEQRLYGINSHWDPKRVRMTRIEEMAAYNLTHLRKIQPHGPYYLSSDCVTTLIVLEMAQQLLAQGEQVAALVLIDPPPPSTYMKTPTAHDRYRKRVERHSRSLVNLNVIEQLAYVSVRVLYRLNLLWSKVAIRICMACRLPLPLPLFPRYIRDTHQRAKNAYVPKPYAGKIWFIWASDDMDEVRRREIQNAWSRVAAQATHRTVPGVHVAQFKEPYVGPLAEQMRICLAEARTAPHPSTRVQDDAAGSRHAVATS
ncbi:MAG: amino acid adenylation domain-containing protein [Pseudomonadota bacterium]|nr:amino acid adenylation domain-containing protein [Pseudomonadota bacterium]